MFSTTLSTGLKQSLTAKSNARSSLKVQARSTTKKGKAPASLGEKIKKGATTPFGNEPVWIEDEAELKAFSKTKKLKKQTIYIGKEKSAAYGNIGEPRFVEDFDEKYPGKEAYGPYGIFDNASGGWAGGEAGLKLMFLGAETEKLKPGTQVNVRYNLDLRSMPYSKLKGKVLRTEIGVNEASVFLNLEDPAAWWESAVYAASAVLLGGVGAVDLLVASQGWDAQDLILFVSLFTGINAGLIYFLVTKNLQRRRSGGKPVKFPIEHVFIPGVDKVPDLFWDGTK